MRVFAVSRHENFIPSGKQNHHELNSTSLPSPSLLYFPYIFPLLLPTRQVQGEYRRHRGDMEQSGSLQPGSTDFTTGNGTKEKSFA